MDLELVGGCLLLVINLIGPSPKTNTHSCYGHPINRGFCKFSLLVQLYGLYIKGTIFVGIGLGIKCGAI
jgi:hypothetical protein